MSLKSERILFFSIFFGGIFYFFSYYESMKEFYTFNINLDDFSQMAIFIFAMDTKKKPNFLDL
jgi:hypothetical protein